ncbi:MAG: acetyl-CoA carboxylase, carboxyltransferase subunit beta [Nitrospiraceae bacterium]|nr:acetyl-CoA carboxylase, carboxyltransferase subunit beta [Nitrospiraceae bacterium]MDA8325534.1 acetyl-CoA carboxylase, carboxyltransferase subunit beta [Nitrospiraceae bacterium]
MTWFKKTKQELKKVKIPEGSWIKCDSCKEIVYRKEIERNLKVCPKCNYHFRIDARQRIELLFDAGSFEEMDSQIVSADPLGFRDTMAYTERLEMNASKAGLPEAAIAGTAMVGGVKVSTVIMDFAFMGGSMGSAVGEKIVRVAERAIEEKIPLVTVSSSGGARMQEGIFSLMQMARVSAAIGRLKGNSILYLSILADPTFGGVTASFAMLGDVIIAEPRSLIGFAGPRVIEQTIKQQLPENFQRSEFLLEHGLIDIIVHRKDMKSVIAKLLAHLADTSGKGQVAKDKE